jgi:hypothetical protein
MVRLIESIIGALPDDCYGRYVVMAVRAARSANALRADDRLLARGGAVKLPSRRVKVMPTLVK